MIGHYLLTLTAEQEDRVLTGKLAHFTLRSLNFAERGGCLMQAVDGSTSGRSKNREDSQYCHDHRRGHVGMQYDDLRHRFGSKRIVAAIRNRILANQARRTLRNAEQLVEA